MTSCAYQDCNVCLSIVYDNSKDKCSCGNHTSCCKVSHLGRLCPSCNKQHRHEFLMCKGCYVCKTTNACHLCRSGQKMCNYCFKVRLKQDAPEEEKYYGICHKCYLENHKIKSKFGLFKCLPSVAKN